MVPCRQLQLFPVWSHEGNQQMQPQEPHSESTSGIKSPGFSQKPHWRPHLVGLVAPESEANRWIIIALEMLDMLIGLCVSGPKSVAKHSVLGLPQTRLVLVICWEDSRDSGYSHIRGCDLSYQNDTKQNQKKEAVAWNKFQRKSVQALKTSFSRESLRTCLIPPVSHRTHVKPAKTQRPRFNWEAGYIGQAFLVRAHTRSPDSWRKASL